MGEPPDGYVRPAGVDPWSVTEALPDTVAIIGADSRARYRNAAWRSLGLTEPPLRSPIDISDYFSGQPGRIRVAYGVTAAGRVSLTKSDTGVGIPAAIDRRTHTLGFQLVRTLTHQLHGTLSLERRDATVVTASFAPRTETLKG
jgi:hypothetical protein